ncbi:MAG: 2-amino-3,7-dideoxy-D-threo-hept-6-ulosonate synthase [Candidatus Gracilibacteria bacterium]|jgi:predicted phospho-2-dehydro-3-deoxyheptonate aldolase|nr:2-amino-3,7-dideoxy-D-threo-hept-6-ulosonate synthase [Candidatus Gracilibacteria bacterium]
MLGKSIRMERIIDRNTKKTIIVPMDHGVTVGPIEGLIDMGKAVDEIAKGGANAVVGHMGLPLHGHRHHGKDVGLILHLSASSCLNPTDPNDKVLVNTVERALKMGADGVSVHVNVGSKTESAQLEILGMIAGECLEWGMPLLAMMYPRGEGLTHDEKSPEMVKIAARIGSELGADIVKTYYTGDSETMREVVEGCPSPVVIAGGSKLSDEETLKMIRGAMDAGCAGLSMGRNAFQHENPSKFVKAASMIVHEDRSAEEALNFLQR